MDFIKKSAAGIVLQALLCTSSYAAYVCVDFANMRDNNLESVKAVLPFGTELKQRSSEPNTKNTNYYRYKDLSTGTNGWISKNLVCDSAESKEDSNQIEAPKDKDKAIALERNLERNVSVPARKIVINLSRNKLFYFEYGELIRSWNVGTARYGKTTPTGTYKIWYKDVCPPYWGSAGDKNVPGCTPQNPFGPKALWFSGFIYGIHGTNEPYLLNPNTSADDRRVSSGCVRNTNENIEWLFKRVSVGDPVVITW